MAFTRIMPYTGIDLVNIPRFKKTVEKHGKIDGKNKFLLKVFTAKELAYHVKRKSNIATLAGRFATKEAVIKAFCRVVKIVNLKEVEVLGNIPYVELHNKELQELKTNFEVNVSITHDTDYAAASAVLIVQ